MLYYLSSFTDGGDFFNLFRYITFRAGGAFFTSLFFGFFLGAPLIRYLKSVQGHGQPIREDGPDGHFLKAGTPTMGGVLILASLVLSSVLWVKVDNSYLWLILFVTVGFGLIGFWDDYTKVVKRNSRGISSSLRLILGLAISLIFTIYLIQVHNANLSGKLAVPIFKDILFDLGILFIPFSMLVISGSANSVNLTDGLDGLAIMPVMIAAGSFGIISYLVGRVDFSDYLDLHYVAGVGEITIFCSALIGAGLGFLWYNAPPAAVFMGDTGSLALGGALGAIAVCTKNEFVLAIIGGLFVMEALSVIIQVMYFKITGKRVFLMAPIHHHFEKLGWAESQIVIRFWIISVILALIGLATLKLR
ncbi:MAG: phospho-N-acetylmuramoyl-pentapeptide-transferase [Paracoccaceae bacterium]